MDIDLLLPPLPHWIVDVALIPPDATRPPTTSSKSFLVPIGLSNDSVKVMRVWLPDEPNPRSSQPGHELTQRKHIPETDQPDILAVTEEVLECQNIAKTARHTPAMTICWYHCTVRVMLYSMSMFCPTANSAVRIAAGTVFHDIFIWTCPLTADLSDGSEQRPSCSIAPEMKLVGHKGAILRLKWKPDGTALASVSEDRSFCVWQLPPINHKGSPLGRHGITGEASPSSFKQGCATLQPSLSVFGHNARVWDVRWGLETIITASEDCTCRVWGVADGQQLACLRGHTGHGVWRCALWGDVLLTAGADSSIKQYNLREWVDSTSFPVCEGGPGLKPLTPSKPFTESVGSAPCEKIVNCAEELAAFDDQGLDGDPGKPSHNRGCSENVRCVRLGLLWGCLYVATSRGRLFAVSTGAEGLSGGAALAYCARIDRTCGICQHGYCRAL